jgi:hypothetical protein
MFLTFLSYAIPVSFTLLVACALSALASGAYLFFFRLRLTVQTFQHPYLKHRPWQAYPAAIRMAMLLDCFLRIAFPKSTFWIVGNANRLLAHVDPDELSTHIKWPLIGLWGGCLLGVPTMLALWIFIYLSTVI